MHNEDLYDVADESVTLRVHAQPGAGRTAIAGRHGHAAKITVAAPPVDGRANDAIARFLAESFGLKAAQVTLVGGTTNREKRFRLDGVDPVAFADRLDVLLTSPTRR
jgi:uncharacterized protein